MPARDPVDGVLDGELPGPRVRSAWGDESDPAHVVDRVALGHPLEETRHDRDVDAELLAAADETEQHVVRRRRERDDHLLDAVARDRLVEIPARADDRDADLAARCRRAAPCRGTRPASGRAAAPRAAAWRRRRRSGRRRRSASDGLDSPSARARCLRPVERDTAGGHVGAGEAGEAQDAVGDGHRAVDDDLRRDDDRRGERRPDRSLRTSSSSRRRSRAAYRPRDARRRRARPPRRRPSSPAEGVLEPASRPPSAVAPAASRSMEHVDADARRPPSRSRAAGGGATRGCATTVSVRGLGPRRRDCCLAGSCVSSGCAARPYALARAKRRSPAPNASSMSAPTVIRPRSIPVNGSPRAAAAAGSRGGTRIAWWPCAVALDQGALVAPGADRPASSGASACRARRSRCRSAAASRKAPPTQTSSRAAPTPSNTAVIRTRLIRPPPVSQRLLLPKEPPGLSVGVFRAKVNRRADPDVFASHSARDFSRRRIRPTLPVSTAITRFSSPPRCCGSSRPRPSSASPGRSPGARTAASTPATGFPTRSSSPSCSP